MLDARYFNVDEQDEINIDEKLSLIDMDLNLGKDTATHQFIRDTEINYYAPVKSQRDLINNVLVLEASSTLCLVVASRRGVISLISGSGLAHKIGPSYQLPAGPGCTKTPASSRTQSWLSDAAVLPDAKAIVYAMSDRSLHFYDTACSLRSDAIQEHRHLWRVLGMPHSVTCLSYRQGVAPQPSLLLLGDEQGSLTTLTFLQPATVLFQRRAHEARPGQAEALFWPDILKRGGPHSQHVLAKVDRNVHSEAMLQLVYDPEQQITISCSLDSKKSLILIHQTGKMPNAVCSLPEGIRCFAYNKQYYQIASGSDDGIVRVWNPLVPSKPSACFSGHCAAVVDVLYASSPDLLFSVCREAELRVWDTRHLHCCLQARLAQPSASSQWASRSLYLWHPSELLVALGPRLAEIPHAADSSSCGEGSSSSHTSAESSERSELAVPPAPLAPWEERQLDSLVAEARHLELLSSELDSEDAATRDNTTSSKDSPDVNKTSSNEMTLDLENISGFAYVKPKFSQSALEIINFSVSGAEGLGMNQRIEGQARELARRRALVEQCAPHLALTLWPPDVIAAPRLELPPSDPGPAHQQP